MLGCRNGCQFVAVIVGIIAGVILGILNFADLLATGLIFWVYLLIGVLGVFVLPLYALQNSNVCSARCVCGLKTIYTIAALGTVLSAAVALIVAGIGPAIAVAILTGIATFFVVFLLILVVCLTRCVCNND